MILPLAVMVGVVGAIALSIYHRRAPNIPELKLVWLVLVSFVLQYLILFTPRFTQRLPVDATALLLSGSFVLLAIFALINRREVGFGLLGLGILCNLVVMIANGGFMPISPETVGQLGLPQAYIEEFAIVGQQFPFSKDIVLLHQDTWLWWLSDIFIIPAERLWWRPIGIAFSIGDVFIALGAIRFFWATSATSQEQPQPNCSIVSGSV